MKQVIALALAGIALAGCETTDNARPKIAIGSLPEYAAHHKCLGGQAFIVSKAEGSPLELGMIASAACNKTRYALYDAITKIESRTFAQGYIGESEKNEPKMIAGVIVRVRQGLPPFG
jgi:hypothetical protein